jgi:WD40 repeat protein
MRGSSSARPRRCTAPRSVYGAAFSPDGTLAVTDGTDRIVRRVKLAGGAAATGGVTELRGHTDIVLRTRFSPDGQSFLSSSRDGTIRVWSPASEEPLRVFRDHRSVIGDAEYIEGGRRIASAGDDGRLLIWSPWTADHTVLFKHARPLPLSTLEVLSRSGHIAVHDTAGAVWDLSAEGAARQVRTADDSTITLLRASPDGSLLAIGTATGAVTVHETTGYRAIHETTMAAGIRQIHFDPQNRDLLIASEDGRVRLVALAGRRTTRWPDLAVSARDVAYSHDGEVIAFVCRDGGAWFYSWRASAWVYARDHATSVSSGRFSRDSALFASTDRSGALVVRDVVRTFARRNR